jgi:hypothetical protein
MLSAASRLRLFNTSRMVKCGEGLGSAWLRFLAASIILNFIPIALGLWGAWKAGTCTVPSSASEQIALAACFVGASFLPFACWRGFVAACVVPKEGGDIDVKQSCLFRGDPEASKAGTPLRAALEEIAHYKSRHHLLGMLPYLIFATPLVVVWILHR